MSLHDYEVSKRLDGTPFFALIMAAMRGADTRNAEALKTAFPHVWEELDYRYNAPQGLLRGEKHPETGWRLTEDGRLLDPAGTEVRAI